VLTVELPELPLHPIVKRQDTLIVFILMHQRTTMCFKHNLLIFLLLNFRRDYTQTDKWRIAWHNFLKVEFFMFPLRLSLLMSSNGTHHHAFLAFLSRLVRYIVGTPAMHSSCPSINQEKREISDLHSWRIHARLRTPVYQCEIMIPVTIVDRYVRAIESRFKTRSDRRLTCIRVSASDSQSLITYILAHTYI